MPLGLGAFDPVLGVAPGPDQTLYVRIRADGYIVAVGDRLAEVAGISAPVFLVDGGIAAAVTLTAPVHRHRHAHLDAVLVAARQLSGKVG